MSQTITLDLPENIARRAQDQASRTQRRLDQVVLGWLEYVVTDAPPEALPDDEVLSLCDLRLDEPIQAELSQLLDSQRERPLDTPENLRLDDLMRLYRRNQVRKARALKVAVDRGLRPAIG